MTETVSRTQLEATVDELRAQGLRVVMITGDARQVAEAVGRVRLA